MKVLTGRVAVTFALGLTLGLAAYLSINAWTLPRNDRPLSLASLDHRWLATAATATGLWYLAHIHDTFATKLWASMLTATAFGRALDLLLNGATGLDRVTEMKAAMAWTLLWGAGIVSALLVNAYSLLWGAPPAPLRGGGVTDGS